MTTPVVEMVQETGEHVDHLLLLTWHYNGVYGTTVGGYTASTCQESEMDYVIGRTYNRSMVLDKAEHYAEACKCRKRVPHHG